jgi:putative nucleotidyltransferase with HDIG domain
MAMRREKLVLLGFAYPVGLIAVAYSMRQPLPPRLADAAVFVVLAYISDWLPIELPRGGSTSVAFATYAGALVVFGPLIPVLASLANAFHHLELRKSKPIEWMLFDAAQLTISLVAMTMTFLALGGHFLLSDHFAGGLRLQDGLAALVGAAVYFVFNTALVTAAVSIRYHEKVSLVWTENFRWLVSDYLALAIVGLLMAATYLAAGTPGVLLLIAPLLVARQTFVLYLRRRGAYYQTVHSLVASIEAKDPYTRGHSERVAQYASRIAEVMRLGPEDSEMLRFAALLHDLGKIGIAKEILNKPCDLSVEEFELVKEHPGLAAEIIGKIGFLDRAVPGVLAHHERLDGIGYGQGLTEPNIPLFARILAVADGFDAMTSERPYRAVMTIDEAVQELLRNSGTQFDPAVVDAFLRAMRLEYLAPSSADTEGQLSLAEAID